MSVITRNKRTYISFLLSAQLNGKLSRENGLAFREEKSVANIKEEDK